VGILHVKVVRAQNLRKKDLLGKSDPYVKLKMVGDKLPSKKTHVKKNNLNPEWNEEFKITVTDPEIQALEVNVYDWEQVLCFSWTGALSVCGYIPCQYVFFFFDFWLCICCLVITFVCYEPV
jgi:C2 domain